MTPTTLLVVSGLVLGGVDATRERLLMGTYARATVTAPTGDEGLRLADRALDTIAATESRLSTWIEASEVSALNRAPIGEPVHLSSSLAATLDRAIALRRQTGGVFDPFIGALSSAWYVPVEHAPSAAEREEARAAIGARAFRVDGRFATRLTEQARVDTGGFGKGVGLDRAADVLRDAGVERALLDLGGQLLGVGGPHLIDISHPRRGDRRIATLRLADESVATSGNAERGRHILDGRSARPASDFGAVTVVASEAIVADAWATALFVLGPAAGMAMAEAAPGVEALFAVVDATDDAIDVRVTTGLRERLVRQEGE